jgi:hypothetical protein
MRPVLAGVIRYESLLDGTLDLGDIALLNDSLSIKDYNTALAYRRETTKADG